MRNCIPFLFLLPLSACLSGELGQPCSSERSCDHGLGCISIPGLQAICSVSCFDGTCPSSSRCVDTELGPVCLLDCSSDEDCHGGQRCESREGASVCWPEEREEVVHGPSLRFGAVVIRDDSNEDGQLNPGESATLQLYAENVGDTDAEGVWLELGADPVLSSNGYCYGYSGSHGCVCEAGTCSGAGASLATVPAQSESHSYLLSVELSLEASVAESVTLYGAFHDALGNVWTDELQIATPPTSALLEVEDIEISDDTNGNELLNPGESATLTFYAFNRGSAAAEGVWMELDSVTPGVSFEGYCYGYSGSHGCDFDELHASAQDAGGAWIDAGSRSKSYMLRVDVQLLASLPLEPISFDATLHDAQGNSWTERVQIPLSSTSAQLAFDRYTMTDDSNDDEQLSPGEEFTLSFYAKNVGTSSATGVWMRVDSPNPLLSFDGYCYGYSGSHGCTLSPQSASGENADTTVIDAGASSNSYLLRVDAKLDPSAPLQPVSVELQFFDELGNSWSDTAQIPVLPTGAQLELDRVLVDDQQNGALHRGQDSNLRIYLRNRGSSQATGVWTKLSVSGAASFTGYCYGYSGSSGCRVEGVSVTGENGSLAFIDPGQAANSYLLQATLDVSPSAPLQPLRFDLEMHDDLGNTWFDDFSLEVQP
ncbi:MAG: hypothetical protein RBU37_04620 [Myxococcota bacterium]|jgi:hypothetical protein|nr:hypothetical protein [Myxococcota bacterium]